MKFPELKIIDKVKNEDPNRDAVKDLLLVQLDWSELDNHKIKSRKDWFMKHGLTKPSKEELKALKQLLEEVDWTGDYLYPTEYKYIFDKYSQFKMSQHYYNECQYLMKMAKDEQDELTLQVLDDTKQTFRLTSIETQGVDPAKETGTEGPTNVEEELNRLKTELEEEGHVGRPKDPVRYGKDDHPEGRDPLGIKTLKQKEGSVKYKPRTNYQEIFKDMKGGKKRILTEDINKK